MFMISHIKTCFEEKGERAHVRTLGAMFIKRKVEETGPMRQLVQIFMFEFR